MALRRLQVTDLRCLQAADVEFDPRFTLISGANASGKTSLLEAIYVLGRGRSFRTRHLDQLVRRGCSRFVVFGEVQTAERVVPIGVEASDEGVRARISGSWAASLAELALILPVQIIDPEVHKLIEEGPSRRRRYLDWGVFHVEPSFVPSWQRYQQVLKQRNAALKAKQSRAVVTAWDKDLLRYGLEITEARARYVQVLVACAQALTQSLLGCELAMEYRPGWARQTSFEEALAQSARLELERGVTQVGPQRAELAIQLDGLLAKDRVSRGQQKLLAAALLIAQIKLFPEAAPVRPVLLLDDPAAELDDQRLARLIAEVAGQANQLIVTTLQQDFTAFGSPGRHYRIAHGVLTEA
jgi:DNA replication and repair protein RecF